MSNSSNINNKIVIIKWSNIDFDSKVTVKSRSTIKRNFSAIYVRESYLTILRDKLLGVEDSRRVIPEVSSAVSRRIPIWRDRLAAP